MESVVINTDYLFEINGEFFYHVKFKLDDHIDT